MTKRLYKPGMTVEVEALALQILLNSTSVDDFMGKVRVMLEDPNAPNYVPEGVLTDCTGCDRDLRAHLQDLMELEYAASTFAGFKLYMGEEPVDLDLFMRELVAGVVSADALMEKVRPMLEDPASPNYILRGIPTDCSCPRDLYAHIRDILDKPGYAQHCLDVASRPQREPDIESMLADLSQRFGVGSGGDGSADDGSSPRIRIVMLGLGSDKIQ